MIDAFVQSILSAGTAFIRRQWERKRRLPARIVQFIGRLLRYGRTAHKKHRISSGCSEIGRQEGTMIRRMLYIFFGFWYSLLFRRNDF